MSQEKSARGWTILTQISLKCIYGIIYPWKTVAQAWGDH